MTVKASTGQPASAFATANSAANPPTIVSSTGAPSTTKVNGASTGATGTPVAGSMYIRTDGTAGARIYWYYGGAWVAQTTP